MPGPSCGPYLPEAPWFGAMAEGGRSPNTCVAVKTARTTAPVASTNCEMMGMMRVASAREREKLAAIRKEILNWGTPLRKLGVLSSHRQHALQHPHPHEQQEAFYAALDGGSCG